MPVSGPSDAGNSTNLTTAQSTPVSVLQSSTLFSSSSTATPTSSSTTAVPTSSGPPSASQFAYTTSSSASATSHAGPSSVSSSVTPATSTTDTFSTQQESSASQSATSSGDSSPVADAKALLSTPPATTTLLSTTPAQHDSLTPLGSTTSTFPPQSDSTTPASAVVPSAYSPAPTSSPQPTTSDANFRAGHHGTGTPTSPPVPEPISTGVPMFTHIPVSSAMGGATVSTHSYIHVLSKSPNPPQQIVSTSPYLVTLVSMTTHSGTIFQTTLTLESVGPGSLVPIPTASSNVPLHGSSNSRSFLPLILCLVLGMLGIVALGVILFRCRARRRSKYKPSALLNDYQTPQEEKDWMMTEDTPQILPYRSSLTFTPECITTWTSPVDESFQSSDGQLSDPFADSSTVLSSRTSVPPGSIRSIDSTSTNIEFVMSVNTDTQDGAGDVERLVHESTSSLELQFASPPVTRSDSWTRLPYLSPTWHYDGQSMRSSSGEERWNEERGDTSHTAPPGHSRPYFLGAENARSRLHALLKKARRV